MGFSAKKREYSLLTLTLLTTLLVTFLLGEVYIRHKKKEIVASNKLEGGMIAYDSLLGWKLMPNWQGRHQHYDFDVGYSTNRYGFRGDFTSEPVVGAEKTAFVGDSFTFSLGVNDQDTFINLLNLHSHRGDVYLNFGVPGYSTDQELLLIRERVFNFTPDRIVLVVYLGNDLFDNHLPFPLQAENAKPYYKMEADELILKNFPVPVITKSREQMTVDMSSLVYGNYRPAGFLYWGSKYSEILSMVHKRYYKPKLLAETANYEERFSGHLELFYALFQKINSLCQSKNIKFNVALMPGSSFVSRPGSPSAQFQDYFRKKIIDKSRQLEIPVIDLAGLLRENASKQKNRKLFHPNEGHLTNEGHFVVAEYLQKIITIENQEK